MRKMSEPNQGPSSKRNSLARDDRRQSETAVDRVSQKRNSLPRNNEPKAVTPINDARTEVIVPDERPRTEDLGIPPPSAERLDGTIIVSAHTPGTIVSRRGPRDKPRTVENYVDPHTPTRVNRYRHPGSPGHSVGDVRGLFVPWSREADLDRRELPTEFPRQRLVPLSPGNQTLATRTITRDFDFYEPPVADYSKNPLRDRYPYNSPTGHYYDLPSGHYPYFALPPDEGVRKYSFTEPILPPRQRIIPKGKWSVVSNKGSIKPPPPRRRVVSDPGKVATAMWIQRHAAPTKPELWPHRIRYDPEMDREFLESPLGKRRYIGHVPRVTDRDRWDRAYDDYLLQNEVDSIELNRSHHDQFDPETSHWIRQHYGVLPDHTDHPNWLAREKEILRQRERERHFGMKRDYLRTRGSLVPLQGSQLGPDWYMSENERLKYFHEEDMARRIAYKDRQRYRQWEDDSDFTSVSQRAVKLERRRLDQWTPANADVNDRYTDYKPNWQVNNNWRYKRPRANRKYRDVEQWLHN